MSESTTTPTPTQVTHPVPTEAQAAETLARRLEADDTLKACVLAFSRGEAAMKSGRLEAGRLADVYVSQRLALGDKRQAATDAVAGELSKYNSDRVDVSSLIRCYHAHRLLNGDSPETVLSYGHYHRVFTQLVERQDADSPAESWTLLPGFEQQAIAMFRNCVVNGFTQGVCHEHVQKLHREYAIAQQQRLEQQAAEARQLAERTKAEHDKARAAQKAAELVERSAKEALETAAADKRAELTAAMEKARQEKLLAQRNAVELAAAKETSVRDAKLAEQRKAAADKAAAKLSEEKPNPRKRPVPTPTPAPAPESSKPPVHNPLATAKLATPKDLAESLRDQLCANRAPVDVLREFARCFDWRASDAKAFTAGLLANRGKEATAFAYALAETLLDQFEAPAVGTAAVKVA